MADSRLAAIQNRKEHNRKTPIYIVEEKVADEETEATESLLISTLPTDMISLISEHLHLFEYRNFRASCKMFRSLVSPLPKTTKKLLPVPILIFFTTDDGQCRMIDPSRDDDSYYCNHLQLPEYPFTVHFCKDGWIVIHNRQLVSLKYLNPLTRVKQDFPLDEDLKISDLKSFGFSTNPTSPDCVTVVFDHDDFGLVLIHYIQYGDQKWKDCRLENQVDFFFAGYSCPLYFAGAFYVLGVDGRLGEFKVLGDGQQSWRIYKKPTTRIKYLHSYHLVECHGDLLAVFIGHMGTWVEVYKFNLSKRKWIKVKSLGNYCLFVSNSSSFSAEPTEAWMRNRIYVPRIKGNRIVFYSLDTCKFHVSGIEDDSLVNLFGTTEPLHFVLAVAAYNGVMPQTLEALPLAHVKAANAFIVIVITERAKIKVQAPVLGKLKCLTPSRSLSQSLNLPLLPYLPTLGTNAEEVELTGVGLTAPVLNTSTSDDCVFLLFFHFQVFWCHPRLRRSDMINWVDQILGYNGKLLCVRQTVILKGIIYSFAMVADKEGPFRLQVASMRMVDGELKVLSLLPAPIGSKRICLGSFSFLLESCGLLYIVSVFYGFSNVISVSKVWELDPPMRNWVEVKCLNGRAFFLGQHCSTWCWGSDNGSTVSSSSSSVGYRKDCLYLPFEKLILYSYCLAERSITPFQTYQNLQPTGVSDYYWLNFKPQHHRSVIYSGNFS
ncbi:hypothetical protein RDABS01_032928 [Bienertia sinuspersici]